MLLKFRKKQFQAISLYAPRITDSLSIARAKLYQIKQNKPRAYLVTRFSFFYSHNRETRASECNNCNVVEKKKGRGKRKRRHSEHACLLNIGTRGPLLNVHYGFPCVGILLPRTTLMQLPRRGLAHAYLRRENARSDNAQGMKLAWYEISRIIFSWLIVVGGCHDRSWFITAWPFNDVFYG